MNKEKHKIFVDQQDGPATRLRITRRGKAAVAWTLAGGLVLGGAAAEVANAVNGANDTPSLSGETVVVNQGDTLWGIAGRLAPDQDPRDVVDELMKANGIVDAGSIEPGQTISVPVDLAQHDK